MILHVLSAAPSSAAFLDCISNARSGDAIVLLGDGVYAALRDTSACLQLESSGAELFFLKVHALTAGVTNFPAVFSSIDMEALVTLTERFPRQQAWY